MPRGALTALSPRERDVLEGLIGGRSNQVIAHQLGLSVRTIKIRRARMTKRLACASLQERGASRPSSPKG